MDSKKICFSFLNGIFFLLYRFLNWRVNVSSVAISRMGKLKQKKKVETKPRKNKLIEHFSVYRFKWNGWWWWNDGRMSTDIRTRLDCFMFLVLSLFSHERIPLKWNLDGGVCNRILDEWKERILTSFVHYSTVYV